MEAKKQAVKKITQKRLMNIALYYLERYESSVGNLRRVLKNRVAKECLKGAEPVEEASEWIESILKDLIEKEYVNDERYTTSCVTKFLNAGKSERFIRAKLTQAGIDSELQKKVFEKQDGDSYEREFQAACRLVQKKKLGNFRMEKENESFYKKDLAVLARAGFSFQIATKALSSAGNEE